MEPLPGGVPTIPGRTPIACQNCANAKTGCDKRVPCSRCAEKGLACSARFARRSSKAATRAAAAAHALNNTLVAPARIQTPAISIPSVLDLNLSLPHSTSLGIGSPETEPVAPVDLKLQLSPPQLQSPPEHNHWSVDFAPPNPTCKVPTGMDNTMNEFMLNNDYLPSELSYTDAFWPDYSLDFTGQDMYSNSLIRVDIDLPSLANINDPTLSEPPTASSSAYSDHTRGTSIVSTADFEHKLINMTTCTLKGTAIPEFEVVIATDNSWPLARCNRPKFSAECPRTGIVHLEALEKIGTWDNLKEYLGQCGPTESPQPAVVSITGNTRDKMTAITQSFLRKALDVHRGGSRGYAPVGYSPPNGGAFLNYMLLPPNHVLEYFLGSYIRSLADYYPLAVAMRVDPNEMVQDNQASTLLVLLMIAQGAAAVPTREARYLSAGLTETSRISLFDIIEKDVELSANPIALRCALLFTHLGAWSGDKWQMDIAMGQRGMYLSVS